MKDKDTEKKLDQLFESLKKDASHNGDCYLLSAMRQRIKSTLRVQLKWDKLLDPEKEALDLIASTMVDIVVGSQKNKKLWHTIAVNALIIDMGMTDE